MSCEPYIRSTGAGNPRGTPTSTGGEFRLLNAPLQATGFFVSVLAKASPLSESLSVSTRGFSIAESGNGVRMPPESSCRFGRPTFASLAETNRRRSERVSEWFVISVNLIEADARLVKEVNPNVDGFGFVESRPQFADPRGIIQSESPKKSDVFLFARPAAGEDFGLLRSVLERAFRLRYVMLKAELAPISD